ncbi:hypothetical protein KF7HA_00491 [Lactococcus lactis]|nr:hypothetical protein [Lactococcus lactis]
MDGRKTFLEEKGFEVTGIEPDVEKLEMMSDQTFRQLTGTFDDFAETVKKWRRTERDFSFSQVLEYVLTEKRVSVGITLVTFDRWRHAFYCQSCK